MHLVKHTLDDILVGWIWPVHHRLLTPALKKSKLVIRNITNDHISQFNIGYDLSQNNI